MTPDEELTVLGRHLSTLPVEPTIGKALIYSVLLRWVRGAVDDKGERDQRIESKSSLVCLPPTGGTRV
jgi:hypothetical protein